MQRFCHLLGAPVGTGAGTPGCADGPAALRGAGLAPALAEAGLRVHDHGDVAAPMIAGVPDRPALRNLPATVAWLRALGQAAVGLGQGDDLAVFLGGDHAVAAATVPAMARRAALAGRPFFALWLDAHPDLHSLNTTQSGNLHGTPVAYFTGQPGFDAFPPLPAVVDPAHMCMIGLRAIDPAEALLMRRLGIATGAEALPGFLHRAAACGAHLHVSLDADFLDPHAAPGVGTPVPGGPDRRAALAIMARVRDSGLVSSLDLVELNPRLDRDGRTARILVELAATAAAQPGAQLMTGS